MTIENNILKFPENIFFANFIISICNKITILKLTSLLNVNNYKSNVT